MHQAISVAPDETRTSTNAPQSPAQGYRYKQEPMEPLLSGGSWLMHRPLLLKSHSTYSPLFISPTSCIPICVSQGDIHRLRGRLMSLMLLKESPNQTVSATGQTDSNASPMGLEVPRPNTPRISGERHISRKRAHVAGARVPLRKNFESRFINKETSKMDPMVELKYLVWVWKKKEEREVFDILCCLSAALWAISISSSVWHFLRTDYFHPATIVTLVAAPLCTAFTIFFWAKPHWVISWLVFGTSRPALCDAAEAAHAVVYNNYFQLAWGTLLFGTVIGVSSFWVYCYPTDLDSTAAWLIGTGITYAIVLIAWR